MNSSVQLNFEIVLSLFSGEGLVWHTVFDIDPITRDVELLTNTTFPKSLKVLA